MYQDCDERRPRIPAERRRRRSASTTCTTSSRAAIEDVGSLDATGNEVYFAANPGEGVATTMFVDRADRAVHHAEAAAAVRRGRLHDQPPLLEQLVRQRERDDQPAVWQLRRAGELGRNLDADDRRRRRRPRSSRRAASRGPAPPRDARGTSTSSNGIRREPRRPRPAGHRSAGRREILRLVPAAVRHADRRLRLCRQRHADEHGGEHARTRFRCW